MDIVGWIMLLIVVGIIAGTKIYLKELEHKNPTPQKSDAAIAIEALEEELERLHESLEDTASYEVNAHNTIVAAMSKIHDSLGKIANGKL